MTSLGTDMVLPASGELIPLDNPPQIAQALEYLRDLEYQIRRAKEALTDALVEHSQLIGSKTITLKDGHTATIKGGTETIYDPEAIIDGLRQAGCPEDRIMEIITETVTYKVRAVEAKRAAAANPDYKQVIDQHTRIEQRRPSVEIK
jgi:hypothetical protein